MSIFKAILHKWNSTNQSYDIIHPETDHAQVTDFGQGTIAHLVANTLASTVTACSTDSVFGKLVSKLLDASGVQYNLDNTYAWYICLGSLFGGLIIQGGISEMSGTTDTVTFPIRFNERILHTITSDITGAGGNPKSIAEIGCNVSGADFIGEANTLTYRWLAFGS